jgi:hypothetical protein
VPPGRGTLHADDDRRVERAQAGDAAMERAEALAQPGLHPASVERGAERGDVAADAEGGPLRHDRDDARRIGRQRIGRPADPPQLVEPERVPVRRPVEHDPRVVARRTQQLHGLVQDRPPRSATPAAPGPWPRTAAHDQPAPGRGPSPKPDSG